MNRNTVLGTCALGLLLLLGLLVSQQETVVFDSSSVESESGKPPHLQIATFDSVTPHSLMASSPPAKTDIIQLANANNRFGFDLLTQIEAQSPLHRAESTVPAVTSSESPNQNMMISPPSVALALAMVRNGTAGDTLTEIDRVLNLDLDTQNINPSYAQLRATLTNTDTDDVELAIANSLWVNQNITLKDQYLNIAQEFYDAQVSNLDFANVAVKNTINQWVADNTNNKIPEIIDAVNPDDAMYLVNAIYFKGSWSQKFDADATSQQPFERSPEASKTVAMMSQTGEYSYYENEQFQAVRLPYGEGKLGMYIFLPQTSSSLEQFQQQLNLDNWQEWLENMRSQAGNISLPKFTLEYDTELSDILQALGMQQVFIPLQADFSRLTDSPVAIDTVKHKTVIEVNEEGSEAAGVTSIGVRITSAIPETQPFDFNVNRPFFFAICDETTESILFMGNVFDPQ
ncbi:MAG: serpin family protein [Cyanobacteria bacterium P01_A01_bin.83]